MRIVSICPSNTEQLAYLGLSSSLVGVDNYSDWPGSVQHLPRLGPDLDINMDAIEQLKPDLVVASLSVPGMEKNIEALEERRLPYILLKPNRLEEIAEDILRLGEATDTISRAREVYQVYCQIIEHYRQQSGEIQKRYSLYWEWWAKPVFTPGGTNWLSEISKLAGGENIFANEPRASVQTDWEEVKARNPDYICLVWVGVKQERVKTELVKNRPGWSQLAAIQNNNLLVLDESLFCRPSPRLLTGLHKVAHTLHPNHFPAYVEGQDTLLTYLENERL